MTNSNLIYSTSTAGTTINWNYVKNSTPKYTLNLFGNELRDVDPTDSTLPIVVSLMNFLGVKYYLELKKQGYEFTEEIESVVRVKAREERIDLILK